MERLEILWNFNGPEDLDPYTAEDKK